MQLRHNDIIIPSEDPFKNCVLKRKDHAEALTNIVESYSDGFVLAINNKWGTGKTTFVKMWQQFMKNKGFEAIYFNAWENDFDSNPLVALISELKSLTKKNDKTYNSLIKKGSVLTRNLLPILAKAVANKFIEVELLKEIVEESSKATSEILKDEIDSYVDKKTGLVEFKKELETFINKHNNNKPLVFIIDELDRCRPNYAVEVLEKIKHFFCVPGIAFILSIDKIQLSHAICGVYGSDKIDTNEYLRRFIDIEYAIPNPNKLDFCQYLYEYFQYNTFFNSPERKTNQFAMDGKRFIETSNLLLNHLSLRQIEKLLSYTRVVLRTFPVSSFVLPQLLLTLIYIKQYRPDLFDEIQNKTITVQELVDKFSDILPKVNKETEGILVYLEAEIVFRYANYWEYSGGRKLINRLKELETLSYKPKVDTSENFRESILAIAHYSQDFRLNDASLEYLFKKINLSENIVS